jgi:hypothetical protein
MGLRQSTAARNATVDAVTALLDAGSGPAVLRIYTATQPAGPGTAASGTLLAEVTLNDPGFSSGSSGVATLDVSPDVQDTAANATGTAAWFRLLDSTAAAGTGLGVLDGTVTATGGGGDLTLATVSIVAGDIVKITSGSLTSPAT